MSPMPEGKRKGPHFLDGTEARFRMGTMTKSADPNELRRLRKQK